MRRKGAIQQLIPRIVYALVLGLVLAVVMTQIPVLAARDAMAFHVAQGLRNSMILISATESGVRYYEFKGQELFAGADTFSVSVNATTVSVGHTKSLKDWVWYLPHYLEATADYDVAVGGGVAESQLEGSHFCIVKRKITGTIQVCAATDTTCCDPTK